MRMKKRVTRADMRGISSKIKNKRINWGVEVSVDAALVETD